MYNLPSSFINSKVLKNVTKDIKDWVNRRRKQVGVLENLFASGGRILQPVLKGGGGETSQ